VLYSLAVERVLEGNVKEARLSFCSSRGGFADRTVEIGEWQKLQATQALGHIAGALERGFLPPAPRPGNNKLPVACKVCDFRVVCGPDAERLASRKERAPLESLLALRELP
jgi:hypothetical protein